MTWQTKRRSAIDITKWITFSHLSAPLDVRQLPRLFMTSFRTCAEDQPGTTVTEHVAMTSVQSKCARLQAKASIVQTGCQPSANRLQRAIPTH